MKLEKFLGQNLDKIDLIELVILLGQQMAVKFLGQNLNGNLSWENYKLIEEEEFGLKIFSVKNLDNFSGIDNHFVCCDAF